MPHPLVYNCAERELLAHGGTLELRKMSQVFCLDLSRIFGVFKTIIRNLKSGVVLRLYTSHVFLEGTRWGKRKFSQFPYVSGYTKNFVYLRCEQGRKNNKKKIGDCNTFTFFCKRQTLFFVIVRTGPKRKGKPLSGKATNLCLFTFFVLKPNFVTTLHRKTFYSKYQTNH